MFSWKAKQSLCDISWRKLIEGCLQGPRQAGLLREAGDDVGQAQSGKKQKNRVCVAIKTGSLCGRRWHHENAHTQHESKHPPPSVKFASATPVSFPGPGRRAARMGRDGPFAPQGERKHPSPALHPPLYLSFNSCVTRLVMRPHSRPMRKSSATHIASMLRM